MAYILENDVLKLECTQKGGTSIIIIVGVILETVKQIESQLLVRNYKGFLNN